VVILITNCYIYVYCVESDPQLISVPLLTSTVLLHVITMVIERCCSMDFLMGRVYNLPSRSMTRTQDASVGRYLYIYICVCPIYLMSIIIIIIITIFIERTNSSKLESEALV